ncbi:MAG: system TPR-repeat protein PrsT, partial [Belnapia sp.]|nr:system TPR-repeat protein PrsT [Belnapia sp.]
RPGAREAAATEVRLAPGAAEPHLATAAVLLAEGDRPGAEAAVDRALAIAPNSAEGLMRKAGLQFAAGNMAGVVASTGRLIEQQPSHVQARVLRAEAIIRQGDPAKAREEVEAALRFQPNSAPATYLRGLLLFRAQDWRGADEMFQRLGSGLANYGDGVLLQAVTKRALGQNAQALDAAQRYAARVPEDIRGAKLLASLELEGNRPNEAVAVLSRYLSRGTPDAEAFDLLGRGHAAAGRPREAAEALQRAAALAPQDAAILARLAAARLASGDAQGTTQAAQSSLLLAPNQAGARELLAVTALNRGDFATAEAELGKLDEAGRRGEAAGLLAGTIQLGRLDQAGARTTFETVLRNHPESIGARVGLARVAGLQDQPAEADRLLTEVLQRDPVNGDAIASLSATAAAGGPRGAAARALLEAAQAATPAEPRLALAVATLFAAAGEQNRALTLLESEPLRAPGRGAALPLARSQAYAAAGRWPEAEVAARAALAEEADNAFARRQLGALLVRDGKPQEAEALLRDGLRMQPANMLIQQTLVGLVQQSRGLDAALVTADEIARQPATQPNSRLLRGDLLLAAQRPADAARAFATAYAEAPSVLLATRQATAWQAAQQPAAAIAALNDWLKRDPESIEANDLLAQIDLMAGRLPEAEARLVKVVERMPNNGPALNNLAWILGERAGSERGGPDAARARDYAERAYFLMPNVETADTLGWILTRAGEPQRALPLLRAAAAPRAGRTTDPGMTYRLAATLDATGERAEAIGLLDPLLAGTPAFPERAEAERLLARLRAGR